MSEEVKAAPEKTSPPVKKEKMYTVKFHSQDGPGGKGDIYVGVGNERIVGRNWQIPREVEVTIPELCMNVIRDAKAEIWETDKTTGAPSKKLVDTYAYTIIRVDE